MREKKKTKKQANKLEHLRESARFKETATAKEALSILQLLAFGGLLCRLKRGTE